MHKKFLKYQSMSDEELVAEVLNGNELAATYIIAIICGSRLKFLSKQKFKTLNLEFDEVVNEVFLYLRQKNWKAFRDFRGQNKSGCLCKLCNYISLIASRLLWKKMEQAKQEIEQTLPLHEVEEWLVSNKYVQPNLLVEYLIDAVMSLENSGEREVLLLYKIEGRNVKEVAQILNTSPGNVYTRCTRALTNLRLLLEPEDVYA